MKRGNLIALVFISFILISLTLVIVEAPFAGDLPKPKGFSLGPGNNSGEIYASCDSLGANAKSYIFRYSQEDGSDPETWRTKVTTDHKVLIDLLISGKKVSVQCAGVGSSKHLTWSIIISIYVM